MYSLYTACGSNREAALQSSEYYSEIEQAQVSLAPTCPLQHPKRMPGNKLHLQRLVLQP